MKRANVWPLPICILLLGACGADPDSAPPDAAAPDAGDQPGDTSAVLFERDDLLEVAVTMEPNAWDLLRHQGRTAGALAGDCPKRTDSSPYSYFPADIRVDGVSISNVSVRKKGYLGSLLTSRPSLKLKLDELVPGTRLHGIDRLTLNNNNQDGSQLRQCIAYWAFRRAGLPAPRCTLARVTVNGQDLGIYTHVESIREELLARHFANPDGALFETQISDFTPELVDTFQDKNSRATRERAVLDNLTAALTVDDSQLLSAVSQWIDVDAFLRFWAMEALAGHWDGYSGYRNNTYIYRNPDNGLLYFIPWGADAALSPPLFGQPGQPQSVNATGWLAYRLYGLPEVRERYAQVMRDLLAEVWSEDALLAEVERLSAMAGSAVGAADLASVRTFIQERRGIFEAELEAGPPVWEYPAQEPLCFRVAGTVSGTFSTRWGTSDPFMPPEDASAALSIVLDGEPVPITAVTATAGMAATLGPVQPSVQLLATRPDQPPLVVVLFTEPQLFRDTTTASSHGFATFGVLTSPGSPGFDIISDGSIQLQQAAMEPDAPVSGSFSGFIYRVGMTVQ